MKSFIEEIEKYRKEKLKIFLILLIIPIIISVIGIVFLSLNASIYYYFIILIFISWALYLTLYIYFKQKFTNIILDKIGSNIVKLLYGKDAVFKSKDGIPYDVLQSTGLFKNCTRFNAKLFLSSSYKDVEFISSDVDFINESGGKNSNTEHNKAKIIILNLERNFDFYLSVCENKFSKIYDNSPFEHKVSFESIEFNDKFKVTTSDETKAFYFLKPQTQLELLEVEKMFDGVLGLFLIDNHIIIVLKTNELELNFSLFKKIDESISLKIIENLSYPQKIIDKLSLYKEKYNNVLYDIKEN